ERVRRELEARLVGGLYRLRDRLDALDIALAAKDQLLGRLPQPTLLECVHQVAVHLEELSVRGCPAEDLRELRVEARSRASNEPDGCGGCDRHERRVAHAALDLGAKRVPVETGLSVDLDLGAAIFLG